MSEELQRVSDGDRDAVIEKLRTAAGEGRLTFEELADRIEIAAASTTRGELDHVVVDLGATKGPASAMVAAPISQSSTFGDLNRAGRWVVPSQSNWKSFFGDITLDLRDAHVPAGEITIEAKSFFGDIDLLVPEGVLVELRAKSRLGDIGQKGSEVAAPDAPKITLIAESFFGDISVRNKRLRERIAEKILGE